MMRVLYRSALGIAALAVIAAAQPAHASTVLINSTTRNGGFETGTGAAYSATSDWFNNPGSQSTSVRNAAKHSGSFAGIVSLASNPTNSSGHALSLGDQLDFSFWYRDDGAGGNPVLNWELFYYTDQNAPGFNAQTSTNRSDLFSGSLTATSTTYQQFTLPTTAQLSDAAAVGKTLYIRFYRTIGDGQFPLIDDVSLSYTANVVVPTPAALPGGLMLLGLATIRRRRSA